MKPTLWVLLFGWQMRENRGENKHIGCVRGWMVCACEDADSLQKAFVEVKIGREV